MATSEALASIETVSSVKQHPRADKLVIVSFENNGYQVLLSKEMSLIPGEKMIFIRPDTFISKPNPEQCSPHFYHWYTSILDSSARTRIRAINMFGEWSYGLAYRISDVFSQEEIEKLYGIHSSETILDAGIVESHIGVRKYESVTAKENKTDPIESKEEEVLIESILARATLGEKLSRGETDALKYKSLPSGIPKTDEIRWEQFKSTQRPIGSHADISLKLDGSSYSFFIKLNASKDAILESGITSRNNTLDKRIALAKNDKVILSAIELAENMNILQKLAQFCLAHRTSLCLRAELTGPRIQNKKNNYWSKQPHQFHFFSCYNVNRFAYESPQDPFYYRIVCHALDFPVVPLIERQTIITQDIVKSYEKKLTTLPPEEKEPTPWPFEGVVVTGSYPDTHAHFSFKIINFAYDQSW
jgi:hypothetical protein